MSNVYSPSLRATLVGARKMGPRPSNVYSPYNVLIIGGGLGGLFTAALLSKSGMRCLVLEKNAIIGGGLQSFRRGTQHFDTGMHLLGGFGKGQTLRRLCDYLGIYDQLRLKDVDETMDEIFMASTGDCYEIRGSREGFAQSWARYFPQEEAGIARYVDALYRITDQLSLFHLRPSDTMAALSEDSLMPADEFIAQYIEDEHLRQLLAYMNPMYGGRAGHTPAYIHAVINVLYIEGTSRFVGNSGQLADALRQVIEEAGGEVLNRAEVTRVVVQDHAVQRVELADGRQFSAEKYVSAVHVRELLRVTDEGAFPKIYRQRLEDLPVGYSAFSVYLTLKEGYPYVNRSGYVQRAWGKIWSLEAYNAEWPHGLLYMTPPDSEDATTASRMTITAPMPFSAVAPWADTTTHQRGAEYQAWKAEMTERVLDLLATRLPNIRQCIDRIEAASPLTIRDYYHSPQGSLYGIEKDAEHFMRWQIPVFTKVHNLYLSGQCVGLHGICGTPLNAVQTAEAILGKNTLLGHI